MKILTLIFVIVLFSCNTEKTQNETVNIVPQPNSIQFSKGSFKVRKNLSLSYNSEILKSCAGIFKQQVNQLVSINTTQTGPSEINLKLNSGTPSEAYKLLISKKGIEIEATSPHGIFNGLQTLVQLFLFSDLEEDEPKLPLLSITDEPRFLWRGIMIDESRYFFGKEKIKQTLDLMALHKLNVFHWHLTDVPGWRIEIKKYPKLTSVGGIGNDIDRSAPAKFYTQNDIREIVEYAKERFIEVIPEIDMPGHATAANRAYPEFSGGGSKSHPEFTFNPGNEKTYTFLGNILKEVSSLFPSKYIHIGGDEVHYGNANWNSDPLVQQLMKKEGLNNLKEVEGYFVNRIADTLKVLNKTLVGWDEVIDHRPQKSNTVLMWWRHNLPDKLEFALNNDYKVILCPRIPLYFDFDQDETHQFGRKWGGSFSPVDLVYNFPPDTLPGFTAHYQQIQGLQANLWTERVQSKKRFEYLLYPRMSALAEAAWTMQSNKNLHNFYQRLLPVFDYLKNNNIYYYDVIHPENTPEPPGKFRRKQN